MNVFRNALFAVLLSTLMITACSPWVKTTPDVKTYTFLDIPIKDLQSDTEKHIGKVFEGQLKFYRIYRNKEDLIPELSRQTITGSSYFTARPVSQAAHVVKIQITPRQDKWLRQKEIERQDVIKARVRFSGITPDGALAFDLLEILEH